VLTISKGSSLIAPEALHHEDARSWIEFALESNVFLSQFPQFVRFGSGQPLILLSVCLLFVLSHYFLVLLELPWESILFHDYFLDGECSLKYFSNTFHPEKSDSCKKQHILSKY
jgi:hypothetical protein